MKPLFCALCLLVFSPLPVWAVLACENPALLRQRVKECAQNAAYTKSAKKCVADFEAEIENSRASLAKALSEISDAEAS